MVCLKDSALCIFGKTVSTTYSFVRMMATTPWTREYRNTVTHKIDWMSYQDGSTFVIGVTETDANPGLLYLDHSLASGFEVNSLSTPGKSFTAITGNKVLGKFYAGEASGLL